MVVVVEVVLQELNCQVLGIVAMSLANYQFCHHLEEYYDYI